MHAKLTAQQHGPGHVTNDATRLSLRLKLELGGSSRAVGEPATAGAMTLSSQDLPGSCVTITLLAAEVVLKVVLIAF